ncbi:hypothetical protein Tco_0865439 [Tanacetum coccineum]
MLGRKRAGKQKQQESSKRQRMEDDKETDEHEEVEEDDEVELKKHMVITFNKETEDSKDEQQVREDCWVLKDFKDPRVTKQQFRNFDLEVMEFESAHSNTTAKLSILKLGEYEMWVIRIKQYFQVQDYALWEVIENGNSWYLYHKQHKENVLLSGKVELPRKQSESCSNIKTPIGARITMKNIIKLPFYKQTSLTSRYVNTAKRCNLTERPKAVYAQPHDWEHRLNSQISRNMMEVYVLQLGERAHGGRISSKGTLKTNSLDFEEYTCQ